VIAINLVFQKLTLRFVNAKLSSAAVRWITSPIEKS
jgi:hypothetical protein